jgi:hypothetical protein
MLVRVDRVMPVVQERGDGFPDAHAVRAVPHAARYARDHRALDLLLEIEHGRIFLAPQGMTERREFAPRRCGEGTMPPAAQCDGNDSAQTWMELQQRNESGFGDPVDRELRAVRPHISHDGQRMDDVTEGRRAYDQDRAHVHPWRCAPSLREGAVRVLGRPRDAHAVFAMRRLCSQDSGETP